MSCNVSISSIEEHITPPHLSSKDWTNEHRNHTECVHHFFETPFVLPDSVSDDLVEFPGELKITRPPRSPPRSVIRKPSITAQPNESPQSEHNRRARELLEGSLLLAHFKSHGSARQPLGTTMRKPLGTLLQATHQKKLPRLAIKTSSKSIPRPPPQQS